MSVTTIELVNLLAPIGFELEACSEDCEFECCVEEDTRIEMSESEAEEAFHDFVNEMEPNLITIMGLSYDPARVLKEVDPIAYRQEFLNWVDMQETDGCMTFPWNQ